MAVYTQIQYTTLAAAIAQGALIVEYGDKKVTYRSQKEMIELLNVIAADLGVNVNQNSRRRFAEHSKGL